MKVFENSIFFLGREGVADEEEKHEINTCGPWVQRGIKPILQFFSV
jgi:hypothetical protein